MDWYTVGTKNSGYHLVWSWSGFESWLTSVNALCSSVRHFTVIVPRSTQIHECVQAHLMLGVTLQDGLASQPGRSRNTPCHLTLQKPG